MKQFRNIYAEAKVRLDEGIGTVSFVKNAIYISAGLTIMLKLDIAQSIITAALAIVLLYILGAVSYFLKFPQEINNIKTGKYNPYFKKKLG